LKNAPFLNRILLTLSPVYLTRTQFVSSIAKKGRLFVRVRHFVFAAALLLSFAAGHAVKFPGARAADQRPPPASQRAELIEDQTAGAVRIMIDGKQAAWFDAQGLHVVHGIEYGDQITDTGPKDLEARAGGAGAP
jgi:hypothetical protein